MNNRIIKFRAWDREDKLMLYWHNMSDEIKDAIPYDSGDEWTERCEVMQFTGLLDKNGKEIYEGDIIKDLDSDPNFESGIYYCVYSELKYCFEWISTHQTYKPLFHIKKLKIIGNIFENPELIK